MQIKQADGEYFDAAVVQREWLAGFITAMNTMWSEPALQITANADPMTDRWQEHAPGNQPSVPLVLLRWAEKSRFRWPSSRSTSRQLPRSL
jgi:hypothetical protein